MRPAAAGLPSISLHPFVRNLLVILMAVLAIGAAGVSQATANPKYAAIVVDANTGRVLFEDSAGEARYPASLTKMMTLYMTFDALQAGRISLNSKVPFSAQAASRPPTKLGVRAGGSITVEQAILALVTKSANDAAAALGELLGGTESGFARMMTEKARQIGMGNTTFRNASGLPDEQQRTTARDMATLGIALREHHSQYYHYFSTRSFTFGKTRMGNHNRLLGRIRGVDGIKTGYIRASGFNLVSSVADGDRRIVAVVMGGRTGASRDAHMAELIQRYLPRASRGGGGQLIARGRAPVAAAAVASLPRSVAVPGFRPREESDAVASSTHSPAARQQRVQPAQPEQVIAYAPQPTVPLAPIPADPIVEEGSADVAAGVDPVATASVPSGWVIQVASLTSEAEAQDVLSRTKRDAGGLLSDAAPFTQTFTKDGTLYYRARFAGFGSKSAAWDMCSKLKRQSIACFAAEN